jgi:glycosyltransferase involved in cell wall biosynthesis
MKLKRITGKIRHALWILRKEGPLSLIIITLISIQTRLRRGKSRHKIKLHTVVNYSDAIKTNPSVPIKPWGGSSRKKLRFNWLMPPPGKGSGGHLNIFRFIKYLEGAGHDCRIYLYADAQHGPISGIETVMGNSYPELSAPMEWLEEGDEMADAEAIFCTSWETAYASYNSKLEARRFYFIQDYEPYFYPRGSLSVLAENTYRFGFYGITAGAWLSQKLKKDFGMEADYYSFGSDKSTYHHTNSNKRSEVLFYVRPFTERRGFEIGIMALDIFHQMHPDITINLVGWDVSHYNIPFPYKNLKTLEVSQLNWLYNRCAAGLIISLTNMTLRPLELLSSGTIPVVNDGDNNRLVSNNEYIAYSPNDPPSLAAAMSAVITRDDATKYSRLASDSIAEGGWDKSGEKFVEIVEREIRLDV